MVIYFVQLKSGNLLFRGTKLEKKTSHVTFYRLFEQKTSELTPYDTQLSRDGLLAGFCRVEKMTEAS